MVVDVAELAHKQIPQRSILLPCRSVLSYRSEAPTAPPHFMRGFCPTGLAPRLQETPRAAPAAASPL